MELNNPDAGKKKDAVKKVHVYCCAYYKGHWSSTMVYIFIQVIANMTVGKDVSMLFTDMVKCMQTGSCADS